MNQKREIKEVELNNFNIDMRQTSFGKDYFIIFDNESTDAYFCFRGSDNMNHEDFERLKAEYLTISQIKLTYYETENEKRIKEK